MALVLMISSSPPGNDSPLALNVLKSASATRDGCSCSLRVPARLTVAALDPVAALDALTWTLMFAVNEFTSRAVLAASWTSCNGVSAAVVDLAVVDLAAGLLAEAQPAAADAMMTIAPATASRDMPVTRDSTRTSRPIPVRHRAVHRAYTSSPRRNIIRRPLDGARKCGCVVMCPQSVTSKVSARIQFPGSGQEAVPLAVRWEPGKEEDR
jgi:hypothetical protein